MDRGDLPRDLAALATRIRRCVRCELHEARTHAVPGEGAPGSRIALVGEAPGGREDREGRPFVGAAGRILDEALRRAGIVRELTFVTNAVKCRPPGNRRPKASEAAACRPYLAAQLAAVRPKVVVALGASATRALLGPDATFAAVRSRWAVSGGRRILATVHPAAVLYNRGLMSTLVRDLRRARRASGFRRPRRVAGRPRKDRETLQTTSAGCVVLDDRDRVLLLRRSDEGTWCFPKGGIEKGEAAWEAALREVREECGLSVDLGPRVAVIRYSVYWPPDDVNYDKRVIYHVARPRGGRVRLEPGFDAWRWATPRAAAKLLPYANDRKALGAALAVAQALRPRKRRSSS